MGENGLNNKLYLKDIQTGVITEIKDVKSIKIVKGENSLDVGFLKNLNNGSNTITCVTWFKILSQKKFRKMLYSFGYQRNHVNKIISIYKAKKLSYFKSHLEYFRKNRYSILWNIYFNIGGIL